MKKYILFLGMLFPLWVSAQNKQIVEAVSGEDLTSKISTRLQYVFPEFTDGDVFYKGHKGKGKINYNMLVGEMQFVENNQVLSLANVKDVVMINIGDRKFYPYREKEFTEEILTTAKHDLRVRYRGNMAQHSKKGAYGIDSSTSATTQYSNVVSDNYRLNVSENVLVTVRYFYYLVGTNGKYTQIKNIKTFTKQFPLYRSQIENFAMENNTRFDNQDDLKELLEYCSKL